MVESLIKGIMQLYMQISTRLVQLRVGKSGSGSASAANIDLAGPLIARVREHAAQAARVAETRAVSGASQDASSDPSPSTREGRAGDGGPLPPHTASTVPGELAHHLSREPRAFALQPPIGEQLKRRTFQYVNHALELANEGKVEAAETCAKLAESALKTAADYLSEEEFLAFRSEVMSRINPAEDKSG
jgi:hypothetical protein